MAAKFDAEMMKKQHFWLLFIPVVIGLFLAWIGLFFGVADATEEKAKANKAEKDKVANAKAQPKKTLELYDGRKSELFDLRTLRWKEMWELQKGTYEWPASLGEDQTSKVKDFKFGKDITDSSFLYAFRDHYAKEYEAVAAKAAPLQFANGWEAVLRHVSTWKRNPTSEDVWLAAEDFWVEKEFIRALAQVNEDAARFVPKPDEKTGIRQRTFINRIWEVNLQLEDMAGSTVVKGTIKNRTSRLQPYNANNELVLNLWLEDSPNALPFRFAIEGTSLEGGKTEKIKFVEKMHTVLQGAPRGIYRVEQVFDTRTAPVKRLDNLVLGFLSDRHSRAELKMASFSTKAFEAENPNKDDPALGGGMGGGFQLGGGPMMPMPGVGPGGPGGAAGATDPDSTFNGLARRRYVDITDQVRAMPVGLTVIVDQAYVQDTLTAVSNSKLRFQTIQTQLSRFRNSLSYAPPALGGGIFPGRGMGEGGPSGSQGPRPMGTSGTGTGSSQGPPPMGGPGSPGGSSLGPMPGGPPRPGLPGGNYPGYPGSGSAPRSSNEDQIASNLMELNIYGITSLYERFEVPVPKDDPSNPTPAPEPKSDPKADPKDAGLPTVDPKDGSPMPPKDETPVKK